MKTGWVTRGTRNAETPMRCNVSVQPSECRGKSIWIRIFRVAGQHPDGFDVIIVISDFGLTGCM